MITWLYGLSGSGKTTLALELKQTWEAEGKKVKILDGDIVREGLCSNLKYSDIDRLENIRRIAELAKIFRDEDYTVIVAAMTPLAKMRELAQQILGRVFFVEVYCSFEGCRQRDTKGLYEKFKNGKLYNFVSQIEGGDHHRLMINTESLSIEECTRAIVENAQMSKDLLDSIFSGQLYFPFVGAVGLAQ